MLISEAEDIVRAVCSDKWDGERLSPSLFVGSHISVSRTFILPLEDHWEIFRRHVQKPPERTLEMIAQIKVGKLRKIGQLHTPPRELTVEACPLEWNPAHAEIPQKISRGLANAILPELKLITD
jgi:hypothetical protein